jgi:hypothetical protein
MIAKIGLAPARADDEELGTDSPWSKTSSDGRIKVTLLYVGPIKDSQTTQPFVITYMVEDCRSDEELLRHPWKLAGGAIDSQYYMAPAAPELKDGTHHLVDDRGEERSRGYAGAVQPNFKEIYPNVILPIPARPERVGIYEWFYKVLPSGPYDVVLHDSIPAYRQNNFYFRDIETSAFSAH